MIKRIPVEEFIAAQALHAEYAEECSIPAIGKAVPQEDLYKKLDASGALRCFGAFADEKLVGFANVLVYELPHYSKIVATVESIFISKPYRNSSAGVQLQKAIEHHSEEAGCVGVLYSCPTGGQFEKVLEGSKSYTRTNSVFYRRFE